MRIDAKHACPDTVSLQQSAVHFPSMWYCRLNSAEEADNPQLQASLLQLVTQLSAVNPTPRPAESDLINGRYCTQQAALQDSQLNSNTAVLDVWLLLCVRDGAVLLASSIMWLTFY